MEKDKHTTYISMVYLELDQEHYSICTTFSYTDGSSLQSDGPIDDTLKGNYPHGPVDKIQFIVVGPFTDDAKKTTGD